MERFLDGGGDGGAAMVVMAVARVAVRVRGEGGG